MNKEEIPVFSWNTKTEEFYVLGHTFTGVNSIEDFIDYITNLDKENKLLKEEKEKFKEWFENEYHLNLPNEFAEFECTDEKILKIYNKIKELEGNN